MAAFLPTEWLMGFDVALGRWLAFCVHPAGAWRVGSPAVRAALVTSYLAAGYVGMLAVLLAR